jgi:iron complex outermembrane receptor protein
MDMKQKVNNVRASDKPITQVLTQVFAGTDISYSCSENYISLCKKSDDVISVSQQNRRITGIVTDESGEPVIGANVVEKGTTNGTITDTDGKFLLNVSDDAVLQVSYIGYLPQEMVIGSRNSLDITLIEDSRVLEEVIVVGYGTLRKKEISGSVQNMTEKDFNTGVVTNASDMLQGKVSGLNITRGSGDITSNSSIRLRGSASLSASSAPYVVIDGIPGGDMNSVAPQDIESISILKDASSAAIYGSRSAGGVILITTKRGSASNPQVVYDGYVAFDKISNKPDLLTAEDWRKYAADNNKDISGMDLGANTDWFDEIMRTAISHNHNLSLSGGGSTHNYRASVNYLDRQGVMLDNSMKRYNAHMMFSQRLINDRLRIVFDGLLMQQDYHPSDGRNFILAYNMIPVVPVYKDGDYYNPNGYDEGNPIKNMKLNQFDYKVQNYSGTLKADFNIIDELMISLDYNKRRNQSDYGEFLHPETERGRNEKGFAKRESFTDDTQLMELSLTYDKIFNEDHHLSVLGGYSWEENNYQQHGAQNRQFVSSLVGYNDLTAGQDLRPSDIWSEKYMSRLISSFGRITYSYQGKYSAIATIRRDGSSKFGKNNKWGVFPSFSAAWQIKEEDFMSEINWLNELKLRAGYGVTGNQEGLSPYNTLRLYGTSGQYYKNEKWYTSYKIAQNDNPDLKWEETSMTNIGIDFAFLKNRISGIVEWYNKRTKDLLYEYAVPVPPYLYEVMYANVGEMSNKGIEVLLNFHIIQDKNFNWLSTFNLAKNKNKITKLSDDTYSTEGIKTGSASIRGGTTITTHIVAEGRPVGTFYGWKSSGLDANGKYIIEDIDGVEGITNDDRTYIGCAQPDFTFGWNNSFKYKRWDASFFIRGVIGNDVLNFTRMQYATTQWLMGGNVLKESLNSELSEVPRYCSYYIEDGSFIRLDNVTLGYDFNVNKINWIQKIRLYAVAQNLLTITNYKGLDPEVDMEGLAPGVEGRNYYPKSRTFMIGMNVSF